MTDERAELGNPLPTSVSRDSGLRRAVADSIAAGLEWLAQNRGENHWAMAGAAATPFVTAYVIARLGELPPDYINHALRQQIEQSLDWLERARIQGSGWSGPSGEPDSVATSWGIMALRSHNRSVARSALDLVLRCRQGNGGFCAYLPGSPMDSAWNVSNLEVSVTAFRALSMCDSAAVDFLTSRLGVEVPSSASVRLSRLYICSEILDWDSGLAPRALVQRASQCAMQGDSDKACEQALLLRCLLRLRNHRAWPAAGVLRDMQRSDGSWPGCAVLAPSGQSSAAVNPLSFADSGVISSITALSALAMSESQPGLYFGSDLPRRFRDS